VVYIYFQKLNSIHLAVFDWIYCETLGIPRLACPWEVRFGKLFPESLGVFWFPSL
jgi:hypothetical protein